MPSHSFDVLASLPRAVPAPLAAMASRWDASAPAAEPRRAASVVLCRDGSDGLETFLLHRHARMAFAASMVVFPGGGVDAVDRSRGGPTGMLRACAVREVREETGVELAAADLVAWAHWITPAVQPLRYDTYFFLAALPPDQTAADCSTETERAAWTSPADALTAYAEGSLALMPPTLAILIELAELRSVADATQRGRDRVVEPVLPAVVRDTGGISPSGWVYRYPGRLRDVG